MSSDINKFYFRLVLLGSNKTGFLFAKFEPKHKPTVEDLFTKTYDLGSIEIKVDILDTSGSMQFPAMRRLSITNGDAFLLVYSVDDESSFEVLKMCVNEIQEIRRQDYQEIPIVFVGNKCELPREMKRVPKEMVSNYVYYELPRLRTKVIECSCKENTNIEAIFRAYLSLARVTVPSSPMLKPGASAGPQHKADGTAGSRTGSGKRARGARPPGGQQTNNGATTPTATTSAISRTSSGGGGATSVQRRPNSAAPGDNQQEPSKTGSAGGAPHADGSSKVALAVRKSCDASIITSMRRVSLGSSREELTSMSEAQAGAADPDNSDEHVQSLATTQKSSIESILKANQAAQNQHHQTHSHFGRLNVSQGDAKPRSRSLIWRPHRKSSKTSPSNQTECRVS